MRTLQVNILLLASLLLTSNLFSQSKSGIQLVNVEQWWAAEKDFEKSSTDEDVFYKGFCQMKKEDFDKAKATFNTISTKPFGKIGLGMVELNAGNLSGAKSLFEAAASETKNKNPEIFIAISRAISNSTANSKDDAIEWAKKAVDMQKNNADYRLVYGEAYLSTQDGGSAITQYEYAQQFAPASAVPLAKIGQVYFRNRNYSLMKENLTKALEKDPNNTFALGYMAQLYYKYKSFDTAKMYQQKVLDLGDKTPEDNAMMANILFLGKDYDGAINLINEIIKGDNKYNYLNRIIGYSYYETKKPAEAIEFLEKFLTTQPKEKIIASDYEYLGKSYIEAGNPDKGAATIKKSLELNPNDKETIVSLAATFKAQKRYDDAIEMYQKVLALPDPGAEDYFQIAQLYYGKKDYANAETYYTKVLELKPDNAGVYYQRANVKLYSDPEQATASARPDFTKFLELSVGQEEKLKKQIVKASIYLAKDAIKNLQDKAAGTRFIERGLALDPENAELLDLVQFTK